MTKVIVAGALANKPGNGGEAWVRLSWAVGLRRLGYEVAFVEQIPQASTAARDWFLELSSRFGLEGISCLIEEDSVAAFGMPMEDLVAFAEGTSLLVNLSGHLTMSQVLDRVGVRLFVDLDPGYTQIWAVANVDGGHLGDHDAFATVGINLGSADCSLPTAGREWIPVLPPVLLDQWPMATQVGRAFTTVGTWRNPLGTIDHEGRARGSKAHGFRRIVDLPRRVAGSFELALEIHPADQDDRKSLEDHGWKIVDPGRIAGQPETYREYVSGSLAECSAAQPIYVETASGWFSDRTAHYLASGRPALVEDTGLGVSLPTGEGLLTFKSLEEAEEGARTIEAEPDRHRQAARSFAERHLSSDVVLSRLLDQLGVLP